MGEIDSLLQPVPIWNPLEWNVGFVKEAFTSVVPGGTYWPATRNTFVFVASTIVLCFAIGYPVAYYIARHAGRTKAPPAGADLPPVLGQLPDADARLDRPARPGRLRQRGARLFGISSPRTG